MTSSLDICYAMSTVTDTGGVELSMMQERVMLSPSSSCTGFFDFLLALELS